MSTDAGKAIAMEERWLADNAPGYDQANTRLSTVADLQRMLSLCKAAHMTLECFTAGDSGEKACYLLGRAAAELDQALHDLRLTRIYDAHTKRLDAMKEGYTNIPDLGLGPHR